MMPPPSRLRMRMRNVFGSMRSILPRRRRRGSNRSLDVGGRLRARSSRKPVERLPIGLTGEILLPFRPGKVAVGDGTGLAAPRCQTNVELHHTPVAEAAVPRGQGFAVGAEGHAQNNALGHG